MRNPHPFGNEPDLHGRDPRDDFPRPGHTVCAKVYLPHSSLVEYLPATYSTALGWSLPATSIPLSWSEYQTYSI